MLPCTNKPPCRLSDCKGTIMEGMEFSTCNNENCCHATTSSQPELPFQKKVQTSAPNSYTDDQCSPSEYPRTSAPNSYTDDQCSPSEYPRKRLPNSHLTDNHICICIYVGLLLMTIKGIYFALISMITSIIQRSCYYSHKLHLLYMYIYWKWELDIQLTISVI